MRFYTVFGEIRINTYKYVGKFLYICPDSLTIYNLMTITNTNAKELETTHVHDDYARAIKETIRRQLISIEQVERESETSKGN